MDTSLSPYLVGTPVALEIRARMLEREDEMDFRDDYDRERRYRGEGDYYGESGRRRARSEDDGGGPHAGRGPRGYRRSDDRIREDVCDRLCEHGFVDASDIEVHRGRRRRGGHRRAPAPQRAARQ